MYDKNKLYQIKSAVFFAITDNVEEDNIPGNKVEERLSWWKKSSDVYEDFYAVEKK